MSENGKKREVACEAREIEVDTFRAAIIWAGEHGREVLMRCQTEEIARKAKALLADRLGKRASLVRIEIA
jgi:hypothetical protein